MSSSKGRFKNETDRLVSFAEWIYDYIDINGIRFLRFLLEQLGVKQFEIWNSWTT